MESCVFRFLVIASLFWSACVSAQTTLNLGRNELLAEQAVAESLLNAIYKKAGMTANVESMPPARATKEAINGSKDGEVARIYSYGAKHPELLRVEPAYYQLTTAAFARTTGTANLAVRNTSDLKNHSIGIIRGVQHSLDASAGLPNVQQANNAESLFGMLKIGRFEVALDTGINGRYMLQKAGFQGMAEVGVLATLPLHHYLNPKYAVQAEQLSKVIKTLTDSGELAKMTKQAEKEFLSGAKTP